MNLSDIMIDERILERIFTKKKKLDSLLPLPSVVVKKLHEYFTIEWTYNSNAIEGNTLSLRETQMVLQEGITIKGKSLREHFEAKNHEKAIYFIEKLVKENYQLTEKDILDIHSLVLDRIEEEFSGRYRNGLVRITGANFIPPNALKVPDLMGNFVDSVNANPEKLDLISHVAKSHHRFVWIHPFFDGNGRTARLIMNLWLMKYGYPPAVILKNDRKKYYDALNKANNGKYEKLVLLTAQSIERSLDMYLEAGRQEGSEEEYVLLSELSKNTSFSTEYLSLLARQGKIDAFKQGRNWYSNKRAVDDYLMARSSINSLNSS